MTVLLILKFGIEGMFTFDKILAKNIKTISNIDEINEHHQNKVIILDKTVNFRNIKTISESILELQKELRIITFCLWKGKGEFKNISSTEFLNLEFKYDKLFDKGSLFLSLKFSNNIKNGKNICNQWKEFNSENLVKYHKNIRVFDRFIKSNFKNEKRKEIKNFKLSKPQLYLVNKLIKKIELTIET